MEIIKYEEALKDKLIRFLTYRVEGAYKFLSDYNVLNCSETSEFHKVLDKEAEILLMSELEVINKLLLHYSISDQDRETLSTVILSICQGFVYKKYLYNLSDEKISQDIKATVEMLFTGIQLSN